MIIPIKYSLRNFKNRKLTTIITIAGFALVVFVFTAVLMMAYGIEKTLIATGEDANIIIARKSANGEISSIISQDEYNICTNLPHLAKSKNGNVLASSNVVVVINLFKRSGGLSNIMVRGVTNNDFELRPRVKIINGRMFNHGEREIIIGSSILKNFNGAELGSSLKFGGDQWKIVGVFDSEGSGFNSEIWGDVKQLQDAFNRNGLFSTIVLKLDNENNLDAFKVAFEKDLRLRQFEPKPEKEFFGEQSKFLVMFIKIVGIFVTVFFSIGAIIGAMITMYAAVANRSTEIGTLLALGFQKYSVLLAFLLESLIISIIGGLLGLLMASLLNYFSISMINFDSFAELEFSFALSFTIISYSISFAIIMGILGGFLPAMQASKLKIVDALRAS